MTIRFLIEKEFKLIKRNKFLPRVIIMMPIVMMLILPFAANMEFSNLNVTIIDNDKSHYSNKLTNKVGSSSYFTIVDYTNTFDEAMEGIESGKSDLILEIPNNFERDIVKKGSADLLISANAVDGTKGGIGSSYLQGVVNNFTTEVMDESGQSQTTRPNLNITATNRFNPHMDYKNFMVPALMVMLLTIMCGAIPALNIVSEKESGTIEQMNVTPVSKPTLILSKLIPYWIIGLIVLTLGLLIGWIVYGITPVGHLITIYISAALYIVVVSGFALLISNHSDTMQQAMFVMFFFLIIMILISGLFTPISSMPEWARLITVVNPLTYFIEIMRGVYLKGSGFADIKSQLGALVIFGVFLNTWAIISYRKIS